MRCRPVNRVVKLAFLRKLARSRLHVKLQYTKMRKRAKSSPISTINRAHKKINWTSKETFNITYITNSFSRPLRIDPLHSFNLCLQKKACKCHVHHKRICHFQILSLHIPACELHENQSFAENLQPDLTPLQGQWVLEKEV